MFAVVADALSAILQGETVARSLRKNIAHCILRDRITNNPPKYTDLLLGKPPLEYCEWIKDDANWGGENEILILSEHFNVEITVILMGSNVTSITYGETRGLLRSGRIFLLYTGKTVLISDTYLSTRNDCFPLPLGPTDTERRREHERGIRGQGEGHEHDHCLSATVAWGCGERKAEEEIERRKMRKIYSEGKRLRSWLTH
jgi:hypothetical protein